MDVALSETASEILLFLKKFGWEHSEFMKNHFNSILVAEPKKDFSRANVRSMN